MTLLSKIPKTLSKGICVGLAVVWLISLISGIGIVYHEQQQIDTFYEDLQITRFRIKVPTQDGQHISAIVMIKDSDVALSNYSVPTIIFVPGANNQKNNNFDLKTYAVQFGFAVVAMEQRGHGESGGYFSLYGSEYQDISDVITYLEQNFHQLNSSHIALVGMSLGGGSALGAQALDDRIYASSIYHPAGNLSDFFQVIGVHPGDYFGFLPGMAYPYPIPFGIPDWDQINADAWYNRSAINLVTPNNTQNLLLLHGSEDDMIQPRMTQDIVNRADPYQNRNDIKFIIREGLGHGQNEADILSFKYTLTWFRHFLMNGSIDITNLDIEAGYFEITPLTFPQTGQYQKSFQVSTIFLILFLFWLFYMLWFPNQPEIPLQIPENPENSENYVNKKRLFIRIGIVFAGFLFSGLFALFRNPGIIYAIFFYPSIIIIPGLILLSYLEDRKRLLQDFSKSSFRNFGLSLLIFAVPFLLWVMLYNFGGITTINKTASPGILLGMTNIILFSSIFAMPFLFMRGLPKKYSIVLIPMTFIFVLMLGLFVTIAPLALLSISGTELLFIVAIGFGLINFIIYHLFVLLQKRVTRNLPATLISLGTIVSVFIWFRFMRVF